jgi:hypothetical protein
MDPTVLQALADQSVLSLQISSESGQGDPQSEPAITPSTAGVNPPAGAEPSAGKW